MVTLMPGPRPLCSILLIFLFSVSLGAIRSQAQAKPDKRETEAENERKRLKTEKDPVVRAESYMKLADIALTYLEESAKAKDKSGVESYVELYRHSVTEAGGEMLHSGVDPYKSPKGYKLLETGIRKQLRTMQDIAMPLDLEVRQPIDGVITVASKIRDEVLRVLFRDSN
jgi:hypothetical protein